jgi:hypothetical protein
VKYKAIWESDDLREQRVIFIPRIGKLYAIVRKNDLDSKGDFFNLINIDTPSAGYIPDDWRSQSDFVDYLNELEAEPVEIDVDD